MFVDMYACVYLYTQVIYQHQTKRDPHLCKSSQDKSGFRELISVAEIYVHIHMYIYILYIHILSPKNTRHFAATGSITRVSVQRLVLEDSCCGTEGRSNEYGLNARGRHDVF